MRHSLRLRLYRWALRLGGFRGSDRLKEAVRWAFFPHFSADIAYELKMEIDPWEWIQTDILTSGSAEPGTLELFKKILRPGDIYFDVGAHVGFHALVACRLVGPDGRVVAIEPQPYNCARVLQNATINEFSNIDVIVAAAGNRPGTVWLHEQQRRDKSRLSLVGRPVNDILQRFQVPMVRLVDLLETCDGRDVRLVKVDVEGYESEVLMGAGSRLANVDNIIVELLPENQSSTETGHMLECLLDARFELRTIRGEAWARGARLPENNLWAARIR